jgi:hypothetical protein
VLIAAAIESVGSGQRLVGAHCAHGKVRVLRADQPLGDALRCVTLRASEQAQGEYLVLLAADSEVVNPNWIESLLNHAQRPEVAIVGAKLVDRDGKISQAGLILGMNDGVGSAFIGEKHAAERLHASLGGRAELFGGVEGVPDGAQGAVRRAGRAGRE